MIIYRISNKSKGGDRVTPRTGRPPIENSKKSQYRIRLTEAEESKLEYCARETGKTKAEIIREGIELVYQAIQKQNK